MYGGGFSMPAQPGAPRSSVGQQLAQPAALPTGTGAYSSIPVAEVPAASPAAVPAQPRMGQDLLLAAAADVPGPTGGLSLRKYEELRQQGLEPARKRGRKRKGEEEAAEVEAAWAAYYQQLETEDPELYQQLLQLEDAAGDAVNTPAAAAAAPHAAAAAAEEPWPPPRPLRRPLLRDGNQLRDGREALSTYHQEQEETRLWRQALYGQQQRLAQEEVQAAKERYQRNATLLGEVLGGPLLQHVAAAARAAAGTATAAAAAAASASTGAVHAAGRDGATEATAAAAAPWEAVGVGQPGNTDEHREQHMAEASKPLSAKQQQPSPPRGLLAEQGRGMPMDQSQLAQPPVNGFLQPDQQQQQEGLTLEQIAGDPPAQAAGNGSVQGQVPPAAAASMLPLAALEASTAAVAVEYAEVAALQLLQQLAEADAGLQAAVQQFAANHAALLPPAAAGQQGQQEAAAPGTQVSGLPPAADSRQQAPQQQEQQQHTSRPPGDPPDVAVPMDASSQHQALPTAVALEHAAAAQQQQQQQRLQAEAAMLASLPVQAAALRRLVQLVAPEPGWFEHVVAAATPEQQVWLGPAG